MSDHQWRVYPSAPPTTTCRNRRQARMLADQYARLGMSSLLFEADGKGDWVKRERVSPPDGSSAWWKRLLWAARS